MTRFSKIAILSISFSLIAGAGAHAADTTKQVSVSYADLDLSKQAGADVLAARIQMAAADVCGGEPDARDLGARANFRACTTAAVREAVGKVGAPLLSAMFGQDEPQVAEAN